jgi:Flp pilus assembly pilin Flp
VSIIESLKKMDLAEYALILALTAIVIVLALLLFSGTLQATFSLIVEAKP